MSGIFKKFEGLAVPVDESEKTLRRVIQDSEDIETVVKHCSQRRVAVQAGAYVGIWPRRLAKHFPIVYTFEPDPDCFFACVHNTPGSVVKIQAALGYERKLVGLVKTPGKAARSYLNDAGYIPTLRVDDLNLPVVDLLYLDIEGSEFQALRGAEETIKRCRPIIGLEDQSVKKPQGLGERWFGEQPKMAAKFLEGLGYRVACRVGIVDVLFEPT